MNRAERRMQQRKDKKKQGNSSGSAGGDSFSGRYELLKSMVSCSGITLAPHKTPGPDVEPIVLEGGKLIEEDAFQDGRGLEIAGFGLAKGYVFSGTFVRPANLLQLGRNNNPEIPLSIRMVVCDRRNSSCLYGGNILMLEITEPDENRRDTKMSIARNGPMGDGVSSTIQTRRRKGPIRCFTTAADGS